MTASFKPVAKSQKLKVDTFSLSALSIQLSAKMTEGNV